jgi:ribosomal protein S18 acetylase RimI-like enzyme
MSVRTLTESDDRAIETVVLAFASDPITRWKWPQAHLYLAAMGKFARAFGGKAFAHGTAYCTDDYTGVALWLPPDVHPEEDEMRAIMQTTTVPSAAAVAPALLEQMDKYHPREPHWYLPLIGVDPVHQGKGHGDALMAYALQQFDRDLPAYLESTNPHNVALYRRHGFEPLGTIQVGSSPTLIPMLRRPR